MGTYILGFWVVKGALFVISVSIFDDLRFFFENACCQQGGIKKTVSATSRCSCGWFQCNLVRLQFLLGTKPWWQASSSLWQCQPHSRVYCPRTWLVFSEFSSKITGKDEGQKRPRAELISIFILLKNFIPCWYQFNWKARISMHLPFFNDKTK